MIYILLFFSITVMRQSSNKSNKGSSSKERDRTDSDDSSYRNMSSRKQRNSQIQKQKTKSQLQLVTRIDNMKVQPSEMIKRHKEATEAMKQISYQDATPFDWSEDDETYHENGGSKRERWGDWSSDKSSSGSSSDPPSGAASRAQRSRKGSGEAAAAPHRKRSTTSMRSGKENTAVEAAEQLEVLWSSPTIGGRITSSHGSTPSMFRPKCE